jgi:hypothetical protein
VRLEGLDQLKDPVTSSGIKLATFRLVAYCLNYATACPCVKVYRVGFKLPRIYESEILSVLKIRIAVSPFCILCGDRISLAVRS